MSGRRWKGRAFPSFGFEVARPIAAAARLEAVGAAREPQVADPAGRRFGGPDRPRRMLYLAAFADNPSARGKAKKLVLAAVMRKPIEAADIIVSRGQPWRKGPAIRPWLLRRARGAWR